MRVFLLFVRDYLWWEKSAQIKQTIFYFFNRSNSIVIYFG